MLRGLAVMVLLLAPAAAAQDPFGPAYTVRFEAIPTVPIKPQVENPSFSAVLEARCDVVLAAVAPTDPQGPVALVDLEFQVQSGVVIIGPASFLVDPRLCLTPPATNITVRQPYQISIPRTAPGLQAIPGTATVHPRSTQAGLPQGPEQTIPFTVTADYYSVNQVKMASKLQECEGGKARYVLEVTNFGNARTHYTFELASGPQGDGWSAQAPEPIVLDTPNRGDGAPVTATVPFVVDCAFGNKEAAYQILIRPAAADDPEKAGNPLTAQVLARSNPPLGIPGPGPVALGLALLGVALLLRRR